MKLCDCAEIKQYADDPQKRKWVVFNKDCSKCQGTGQPKENDVGVYPPKKCKECFFYEKVGESERICYGGRKGKVSEIGFCHHDVPSVYSSMQYINMPIYVCSDGWCGEFARK